MIKYKQLFQPVRRAHFLERIISRYRILPNKTAVDDPEIGVIMSLSLPSWLGSNPTRKVVTKQLKKAYKSCSFKRSWPIGKPSLILRRSDELWASDIRPSEDQTTGKPRGKIHTLHLTLSENYIQVVLFRQNCRNISLSFYLFCSSSLASSSLARFLSIFCMSLLMSALFSSSIKSSSRSCDP